MLRILAYTEPIILGTPTVVVSVSQTKDKDRAAAQSGTYPPLLYQALGTGMCLCVSLSLAYGLFLSSSRCILFFFSSSFPSECYNTVPNKWVWAYVYKSVLSKILAHHHTTPSSQSLSLFSPPTPDANRRKLLDATRCDTIKAAEQIRYNQSPAPPCT